MKLKLICILFIPLLTGCNLVEDCEECEKCKCCCNNNEEKEVVFINNDNYYYFIKKNIEVNIVNEQKYFNLNFVGLRNDAVYNVSFKYTVIGALNCEDKEEVVWVDSSGFGKTPSYIFDYSGPTNEFLGINITGAFGTAKY